MTTQPFSCHHGGLGSHLPGTQRQLLGGGATLPETWHCCVGPDVRGSGRRRLRPYRCTSMSCADILAAMLLLLAHVLTPQPSRHLDFGSASTKMQAVRGRDCQTSPSQRQPLRGALVALHLFYTLGVSSAPSESDCAECPSSSVARKQFIRCKQLDGTNCGCKQWSNYDGADKPAMAGATLV